MTRAHSYTTVMQSFTHETNNSAELTQWPSDVNIDLWKQSFLPACIIRSINIAARWSPEHYRPVAGSVLEHAHFHTHTKMQQSPCQILNVKTMCCTHNVCYISNYHCNTLFQNILSLSTDVSTMLLITVSCYVAGSNKHKWEKQLTGSAYSWFPLFFLFCPLIFSLRSYLRNAGSLASMLFLVESPYPIRSRTHFHPVS